MDCLRSIYDISPQDPEIFSGQGKIIAILIIINYLFVVVFGLLRLIQVFSVQFSNCKMGVVGKYILTVELYDLKVIEPCSIIMLTCFP